MILARPPIAADDMRRRLIRETEVALWLGLRCPELFHRIPTVEVGKGSFSRRFAREYWACALGLPCAE